MFHNIVMRRIFGAERGRGGLTKEWRRLYSEELRDFCCSPDIATVVKPRGHVARMRDSTNAYKFSVGSL